MVNDKVSTANKIALASSLPISVTIIGVGTADFSTVCDYIVTYVMCYTCMHTYIYICGNFHGYYVCMYILCVYVAIEYM